jgi:hypothetical protein
MPKISELTSVSSLTGTEELPVVQSASTKKATVNDLLGYKVYVALVAYDTLGDQMVVQTFRDDFGDITVTRVSAGQYNIESSGGLFETNKTQVFISQDNNTGGGGDGNFVYNQAFRENSSNVKILINDVDVVNGGNTAGDFMSGLSIEIRVYP